MNYIFYVLVVLVALYGVIEPWMYYEEEDEEDYWLDEPDYLDE